MKNSSSNDPYYFPQVYISKKTIFLISLKKALMNSSIVYDVDWFSIKLWNHVHRLNLVQIGSAFCGTADNPMEGFSICDWRTEMENRNTKKR